MSAAEPRSGMTRATLLKAGAAAALTLAGGGASEAFAARAVPRHVRRSSWGPLVGRTVEARIGRMRSVRLRVVAVEDLASGPVPITALIGNEDSFSVVLRGPRSPRLGQGVVPIRHPALGTAPLLLVPARAGKSGQDYVVTVNRARPLRA
jgi:uncharacterized protein DUF6916